MSEAEILQKFHEFLLMMAERVRVYKADTMKDLIVGGSHRGRCKLLVEYKKCDIE